MHFLGRSEQMRISNELHRRPEAPGVVCLFVDEANEMHSLPNEISACHFGASVKGTCDELPFPIAPVKLLLQIMSSQPNMHSVKLVAAMQESAEVYQQQLIRFVW